MKTVLIISGLALAVGAGELHAQAIGVAILIAGVVMHDLNNLNLEVRNEKNS